MTRSINTILRSIVAACILCITFSVNAQSAAYWQQQVDYKMDVKVNVENYRYTGTQDLKYTNNSPDTLNAVYYHLYFNAFQPGSEMDMRSRNIADPDRRVGNRISALSPSEIGYLKVNSLKQNGKKISYTTEGTILEVKLDKPVMPGETVKFDMEFEGQVPVQIRRSGRNNKDGVALSMTQWYPKMAEYDFQGWHPDPYIAREFHGVWGDFDVKITIDRNYVIGGTGYLQNANEIGHGYEDTGVKVKPVKGNLLTWHFKAPMVHDFAWAADPDFAHDKLQVQDGPMLHFFYKKDNKEAVNWKEFQPKVAQLMQYFSKNVGKYPYKQYSVIQGGDGGMEYQMCTLITGGENLKGLLGTTAHEMGHAWFQGLLASNESKHEWMDEGFTTYIESLAENAVIEEGSDNPFLGSYRSYIALANSGKEQPLTTHSDRYQYNAAYSIAAYSKGCVFLAQLGYVIGQENLKKTIRKYFDDFHFKHPTPNDIKRTAEKVSGMVLDWYLIDFAQTTNKIDYGIKEVVSKDKGTSVTLERIELMPMPMDIEVTYTDGSKEVYYIPLSLMRGEKPNPDPAVKRTVLKDWGWSAPTYTFSINRSRSEIRSIEIDPSEMMADVNRDNNTYASGS